MVIKMESPLAFVQGRKSEMPEIWILSRICLLLLIAAVSSLPADCKTLHCAELILKAAGEKEPGKKAALVAKFGYHGKPNPYCDLNYTFGDAAHDGRLDVLQASLALAVDFKSLGFDINGSDNTGEKESSLGIAGLIDIAIDHWPPAYSIPLVRAASGGKLEAVKWLLEHGASIDMQESIVVLRDPHSLSTHQLNPEGGIECVKVLRSGNNALSAAVIAGQTTVAQFLVAHGADVSRTVVFREPTLYGLGVFYTTGHGWASQMAPGYYLIEDADRSIRTNLTSIRLQEEGSIRSLMAASTIPEIAALATAAPDTSANSAKPQPNKDKTRAAPTWTDPATGLMWSGNDSGDVVNWNEAVGYCRNLSLAGHSDWRLPSIEELQAIFDPGSAASFASEGMTFPYHIKGGLY
jgi:hypothetical protein